MIAIVTGAILTALALVFVLWPLIAPRRGAPRARVSKAAAPQDSAVRALREIEFDRATGKLADDDYATLKAEYTTLALGEMRAVAPAAVPAPTDPAEILIAAARAAVRRCASCDTTRPEPDAVYCSACGAVL
jgi:cytochrome c-type biogenesis protein CcmI